MSNNGSAKDKFVSDMIRGLVYNHNRANANTAQLHETSAALHAVVELSKEDVQEYIVQWDLGQPYIIARDSDGYCVHLNRKTWSCRIYDNRPIPCRGYDCRKDKRIWLEFENKVLNPRIAAPDWLTCLETEAMTIAGKTSRSDSYKEFG